MKNLILLLIILITFPLVCFSQDYADLIMKKIINDEGYLYNVKFTQDIPGGILVEQTHNYPIFKMKKIDAGEIIDYNYRIYYYELQNSIIPLAIKEIMAVTKNNVTGIKYDFIFNVKNFRDLSLKRPGMIDTLITMIIERKPGAQETFKYAEYKGGNNHYASIKNKNQYYTDFEQIVNNQKYSNSATSIAGIPSTQNTPDFYLELGMPGLFSISNFANNLIDDTTFYFLDNCGFEFGLRKDNILNMLEFQNPVITYGFHSFWKIYDNLFTDFKFFGQSKYNNKSLVDIKNGWPFFDLEKVQINKASGIGIDAHFLGALGDFKLPFINIYYSHANENFKDPVFSKDVSPDLKQSYFSLNQLELSLSFFWNLDNSNYNKVRMDIGAGSYDIYRVYYDKNNNNSVISTQEINQFIQWIPVIGMGYIHSSKGLKFGTQARYFDKRVNFNCWLRLLQSRMIEVRIEENYISDIFSDSVKDWEHSGSSNMMQLVFRYGLN